MSVLSSFVVVDTPHTKVLTACGLDADRRPCFILQPEIELNFAKG